MLPLTIQDKNYLAVSCEDCHVIRLINLDTEEVIEAYYDNRIYPSITNLASEGSLHVLDYKVGKHCRFHVFNCSTTHFQFKHESDIYVNSLRSVCCIPPHDILIISRPDNRPVVCAISTATSNILWESEEKVNGT